VSRFAPRSWHGQNSLRGSRGEALSVLRCEKPEGRRAPHGSLSRLRAAQRCADGISRTRLFATRGTRKEYRGSTPDEPDLYDRNPITYSFGPPQVSVRDADVSGTCRARRVENSGRFRLGIRPRHSACCAVAGDQSAFHNDLLIPTFTNNTSLNVRLGYCHD